MKFLKDILVLDFEGGHHGPKQLGAVLLDKETLDEKDRFVSYMYLDMQGIPSLKSGITQDMLDDAPQPGKVAKKFYKKFGTNVFLASFVSDLDIQHLRRIIKEAGLNSFEYDYHILDIWPLAYTHLLKNGYEGNFDSESIFQAFGFSPRANHNALEDARIAAGVLRKIVFDLNSLRQSAVIC
jgi:DNA polymerase III alpha subunit (gram-positive type)